MFHGIDDYLVKKSKFDLDNKMMIVIFAERLQRADNHIELQVDTN